MPNRESTRKGSRRSQLPGARCAAGRSVTTSLEASARWDEPERRRTRDGAERRALRRQRERDPADVAAQRTARVLLDRPACERLRIHLAALQTADALEGGEQPRDRCNCLHTR